MYNAPSLCRPINHPSSHSLPILGNPTPNNRLLTRMSRSITSPTILTDRLLDLILIIARKPLANLPLPIARLHNLIQDILLRLLVRAAEILHQLLDRGAGRHKQLDVLGGVLLEHGCLPGFLFRLEDVDLAVLLWEGVVVAWGQTDAACVVAQVDAREAVVGEGGHGRVCGAAHAEATMWRHEHRLLLEAWKLERRSRPAEALGCGCWCWCTVEGRILGDAEGLGWTETRRHRAIIEAVEAVEASSSQISHFVDLSWDRYWR